MYVTVSLAKLPLKSFLHGPLERPAPGEEPVTSLSDMLAWCLKGVTPRVQVLPQPAPVPGPRLQTSLNVRAPHLKYMTRCAKAWGVSQTHALELFLDQLLQERIAAIKAANYSVPLSTGSPYPRSRPREGSDYANLI